MATQRVQTPSPLGQQALFPTTVLVCLDVVLLPLKQQRELRDTWLAFTSRSRPFAGKKRASFSLWPAAHVRSSCKTRSAVSGSCASQSQGSYITC